MPQGETYNEEEVGCISNLTQMDRVTKGFSHRKKVSMRTSQTKIGNSIFEHSYEATDCKLNTGGVKLFIIYVVALCGIRMARGAVHIF